MKFSPTSLLPILALSMSACGSSTSVPASSIGPSGVPSGAAPTVTAISPASGSIGGTARIVVTGTALSKEATASFGGASVRGYWDPRHVGTMLIFYTQAHAAGTVDVVVTNPDGQIARLNSAYTFVPQQSFDFNGDWAGFGNNGQDSGIRFSIQNGKVHERDVRERVPRFGRDQDLLAAVTGDQQRVLLRQCRRHVLGTDGRGRRGHGTDRHGAMPVRRV